jgi:hypothetical protein
LFNNFLKSEKEAFMGFDLFGLEPKAENGVYFRNNVWAWRPLWGYVCQTCGDILSATDMENGKWNNGYRLIKKRSVKVSNRLFELIESGAVNKIAVEDLKKRSEIPLETCRLCNGTGIREDNNSAGECHACNGNGKRQHPLAWYHFEEDNVRDFAEFCRDSGGFYIC